MSLGENIYKLRTGKRMSQEDFASAMEVSRQSVSKWENDMAVPELEKLIKMAKIFEVSLDELVSNAPPQPEPEPADAPPPGITTGDLISVVLLFLGILIPAVSILTMSTLNSIVIFVLGMYVAPPLVIFCAMRCSPNNKLILRVYLGYGIIICLVGGLFMMGAPVLAPIALFPTLGVILFWHVRFED